MANKKKVNDHAIALIKTYQKTKSPIGSGHCKYYPTCSQYSAEAYAKFSFFKASWLTFWRILRCNPFTKGGFDPVPLSKAELVALEKYQKIQASPLGDLMSYLIYHYQLYPELKYRDLAKLIYQAYYGPNHLFSDRDFEKIKQNILDELTNSTGPKEPYLPIGNGMVRIDLRSRSTEEIDALSKALIATTKVKLNLPYTFEEAIVLLNDLLTEHIIAIDSPIETALPKPFSHSQEYIKLYEPHYRIIHASVLPAYFIFNDIMTKIAELRQSHDTIIIAIDGPAASGKTTLAKYLSRQLPATIIHMDDFFLPPKLKKPKRLAQVGGNVHYERLEKEVLIPLKQGKLSQFRRYDCQTDTFIEVPFTPQPIIILEGVYSYHPALQPYIDLLLYTEVDEATQTNRLKARCTKETFAKFQSLWLPLEKQYFNSQIFKFPGVFIIPQGLNYPF